MRGKFLISNLPNLHLFRRLLRVHVVALGVAAVAAAAVVRLLLPPEEGDETAVALALGIRLLLQDSPNPDL